MKNGLDLTDETNVLGLQHGLSTCMRALKM